MTYPIALTRRGLVMVIIVAVVGLMMWAVIIWALLRVIR
jgi:hypothetical protein